MKTSTLLIKSTVLATAFILAGAANAQGYSADQAGSPPPYEGSATGGSTSGGGTDYGPSETTQRGYYERYGESMGSGKYSCESSESDRRDMYDHCGYNGTGPRVKGRY